ncbi:hypothetical protein DMB44_03750 [Thermoplasma sp. Kam2015]|uniref:hypothetical protein n=1 Tax=Thermoplasma sp. Kam2015 TaxID=2094122 RepID=UPI000D861882|nr:hypothetical protein [Thermoplasma sp. Kam2015]PYB68465.1 hypothetical protein DMB44_03750 [Thermoplasma sp. Kam2015]
MSKKDGEIVYLIRAGYSPTTIRKKTGTSIRHIEVVYRSIKDDLDPELCDAYDYKFAELKEKNYDHVNDAKERQSQLRDPDIMRQEQEKKITSAQQAIGVSKEIMQDWEERLRAAKKMKEWNDKYGFLIKGLAFKDFEDMIEHLMPLLVGLYKNSTASVFDEVLDIAAARKLADLL